MQVNKTYLILDNIRSAENVGAIFRTADAVGINKIFLVGITPLPIDRFGRPQPKIKKTALGAENVIEWEQKENIESLISEFKKEDISIIAIEQAETAVDYKQIVLEKEVAFIFGSEVDGLSPHILSLVDVIAEIPMHGMKESLNVSVAVGVFLFRVLDR